MSQFRDIVFQQQLEFEARVQHVWDQFPEEVLTVFKLSVPEKEVVFPMGVNNNPLPALDASLRLTQRCDELSTIQSIVVTKRNRYVD